MRKATTTKNELQVEKSILSNNEYKSGNQHSTKANRKQFDRTVYENKSNLRREFSTNNRKRFDTAVQKKNSNR